MSEDVVFKGSRTGLQLVFNENVEFAGIINRLKVKLESATNFFGRGTIVNVATNNMTAEQILELEALLGVYGMILKIVPQQSEFQVEEEAKIIAAAVQPEPLIINRTLRGGQEIIYEGSVIVQGNVNPGAKIVAGGDIEVRGSCRGIVHAGAFGNVRAVVKAEQMLAMQVRIADLIARAPDQLEKVDRAEYASVKNGSIVIEPISKQGG